MAQDAPDRGRAVARQRSTVESWLSTQSSPNTRAAYRSDLEVFGSWCARSGAIPLTADTATLVAFQAARQAEGDSAATIRRRWSALSSFYDFAVERELRSNNPSTGADRPKVASGDPSSTVQLTADAVASYRAAAAALDPRLEALVALLVLDGLKVSEALALDIDDVTGKAAATTITVRRRGEVRRVLLGPDSSRAIRRCVGTRRTGPVFVSERSSRPDVENRLTRFGADHLIRQLRTDSNSEPVTANALRRYHITARRHAGSTLDDVRAGAGLADVRSVMRYVDDTTQNTTTQDAPQESTPSDVAPPRGRRSRRERSPRSA